MGSQEPEWSAGEAEAEPGKAARAAQGSAKHKTRPGTKLSRHYDGLDGNDVEESFTVHGMPKRPKSGFMCFLEHYRGVFQAQNASAAAAPQRLVCSEAGKVWRGLSPEEREPFERLSDASKAAYAEAMRSMRLARDSSEPEWQAPAHTPSTSSQAPPMLPVWPAASHLLYDATAATQQQLHQASMMGMQPWGGNVLTVVPPGGLLPQHAYAAGAMASPQPFAVPPAASSVGGSMVSFGQLNSAPGVAFYYPSPLPLLQPSWGAPPAAFEPSGAYPPAAVFSGHLAGGASSYHAFNQPTQHDAGGSWLPDPAQGVVPAGACTALPALSTPVADDPSLGTGSPSGS